MREVDRRQFIKAAASGVATAFLGGRLLGCADSAGGGATTSSGGGATSGSGSSNVGGASPGTHFVPTGDALGGVLPRRVPSSLGRSGAAELDVSLQLIAGRLPADLSGHAFTIAPVPHGDGTYVFNGDGLVYRLDFGAAQVGLRSRVMRTPCYYADQATLGTSDGFRNQGGGPARLSSKLGVRNQVNTAFLAIGPDRLLVTYDAGRPFEIDPVTLEVVTAVGWNHEWHPALQSTGLLSSIMGSVFPLVQTSAHPVWDDRTRELFTLNFGNQGIQFVGVSVLGDTFTDLIRWDGQGALERFELVDDRGRKIRIAQSAHQIQVTQDYVLVMDCAFSMEMEKMINPHYLRPQLPDTIVYVVRRSDLQGAASGAKVLARRVVIPREAAHFVADYDNPGGRITMQVAHNCASDPSEWLMAQDREFGSGAPVRLDLAGLIPSPTDISYIGHHVIDGVSARWIPSQSFYIKDDGFSWGAALYTHRGVAAPGRFEDVYWSSTGFQAELLTSRIANTYANYTHRTVPMSQLPVGEGRPTALFRMSRILGGIADGYRFPDGRMGMSPQFVPRQGGSGGTTDGYVVCTVVSDDTSWAGSSGDEFWIFQASDLARGPLCRLGHPLLNLPFTLHTTWLPTLQSRTSSYKVDVEADHQAAVGQLGSSLQAMFRREVYPHF